ncbi:ABC transporter ATP-binding protein [Paenibacillus agri]|uniref:Dipeptide ABC transporter ATP-binding protein n=1 Tax=Paenibacillus agri TaxID=2744309 RepID=A0A850EPJ1_9BACL|nr:dipeptide ABC transporter ATP-binding protein [Paenibacillus agri]NUU60552.1 dipeptide ABC transporter ATP-binding protein [Paenibacillus agri]
MTTEIPLIELRELEKYYTKRVWPQKGQVLRAVDGVSVSIRKGETLGLVGESGCGKSTLGQITARLLEPTGGGLFYKGEDIAGSGSRNQQDLRRRIQYVFQDPFTSLNPRFKIGRLLEEPLKLNRLGKAAERWSKVSDMLESIGLDESYRNRYAHELSGGQRQRIGIARALMLNPEFLVLDEPVSALDVSVQAQVLNLLKDLQQELSLTYLFISHDLNVVHYMSDRVAVMYLGKIVEIGEMEEVYAHPLHPYTQALVSSIPAERAAQKRERIVLQGDLPDPSAIPSGCAFRTRCMHAHDRCFSETPTLADVREGHAVSCHLWSEESYSVNEIKEVRTASL